MEHPLFLLAYRKLEPAATWDDLLMRMESLPSKPVSGNTISMRINRILDNFSIVYTWHGTKDWVNPTRDQRRREGLLSDEARANNTTRGFTPGLIDLSKGEKGGRIPLPGINGKCEGRGQAWNSRQGKKTAFTAAGARNERSTRPLTILVDDFEDQPCPEFEIDYIAKSREENPGDRDFDNQSTISDESYPATKLDNASQHHRDFVDLESSDYMPILSDQTSLTDGTYYAAQSHGECIDLESSDVHSNMCAQPYPTIEMGHAPQHYQEVRNFESSDGQSYTSSDMMFPDQDYQSSSSSVVLEDQHIQVHQLKIPVEHRQQYTEFPDHDVQPYIVRRMDFQDKATLPTMAFPDSSSELDPRLQMFNVQYASDSSLYHTQQKSDFPMIDNQELAASSINSDAQTVEPNENFQLVGNQPTAPTIGFETQPFEPNASFRAFGKRPGSPLMSFRAQPFNPSAGFQSFGDHSAAPVIGFEAQPLEPKASFEPFNNQPATTFEEFINSHAYETQSNFQSSDNQSTSPLVEYTYHQGYELQSGFNISDNQRLPASSLSVAETPFDLDLVEQNSEDNASTFEKPVDHQEGNASALEKLMSDHENLWYY